MGENLRASLEQLPLSRELTTIKLDVPLDAASRDLTPSAPDLETLRGWYERFESKRLLATLGRRRRLAESRIRVLRTAAGLDYETVLDAEAFEAWLERLEAAELFAFDTETTSLDYMQARDRGRVLRRRARTRRPMCRWPTTIRAHRISSTGTGCCDA